MREEYSGSEPRGSEAQGCKSNIARSRKHEGSHADRAYIACSEGEGWGWAGWNGPRRVITFEPEKLTVWRMVWSKEMSKKRCSSINAEDEALITMVGIAGRF